MEAANRETKIHLQINIIAYFGFYSRASFGCYNYLFDGLGEPDVCCETRHGVQHLEEYQPFTVWEEVKNTDRANKN
jgi:hypothetical protein